jgi:hypothetical protein
MHFNSAAVRAMAGHLMRPPEAPQGSRLGRLEE